LIRADFIGVGVAALLLLAAAPVAADELDDARKKIEDIDYEGARTLVNHVLERGGMSTADLARAHQIAGEVDAVLGDATAAEDHFVALLVLDPGAELDAGVSPKIAERFAAAKGRADILGKLSIEITAERQPDDGRALVTLGGSDPLEMIFRMRIEAAGGGTAETRDPSVKVAVPEETTELTVTVFDAHDDVLAVRTISVEGKLAVQAAAGGGGGGGGGWPTLVRWPTWTVAAVAAGAAGGYFTWQVGKDEDELAAINASPGSHTFDEAVEVRDRGDRHALYANIAYGVAGAAAIAAVLTYVLEPDDAPVEVTPAAGPDGASVSATLRF